MIFLNVRTRFCCHIDLLTHREAVISEQLVTASLRFILTWCRENLYLCVDTLKAKEYHHNLIHIYMSQTTQSHVTASATSSTPFKEKENSTSEVTSVSGFIEKIVLLNKEKEAGGEIFYRGHADESWKLLPSIFRTPPNRVEKEHLLFRDMVAHEPHRFSECKSALEFLVQMQHYELPTRLLDVTMNPLIALYFACQSRDDVEVDSIEGLTAARSALSRALGLVNAFAEAIGKLIDKPLKEKESIHRVLNVIRFIQERVRVIPPIISNEDVFSITFSVSEANVLRILNAVNRGDYSAISRSITQSATESHVQFDVRIAADMAAAMIVAANEKEVEWVSSVVSTAGAIAGAGAGAVAGYIASILAEFNHSSHTVERAARVVAEAAVKAAIVARDSRGAVYLFSIPEAEVKHYDSDTVSVLANLAKCSDREIDIYTEQTKGVVKDKVLEKFNKRDGTQILLRQIKEEKPYFDPLIRPNDLSSIFLVKAKYGNPRIINQVGAFFIFGLGLIPSAEGRGGRLTKKVDHEIPSDWIRHKFIIPKDKKQNILDELARMGITESYLFPEMDKYAKELKKKYEL